MKEFSNEGTIEEKLNLIMGENTKSKFLAKTIDLKSKKEFHEANRNTIEEDKEKKINKKIAISQKKQGSKHVAYFDKLINDFDLNSLYEDNDYSLLKFQKISSFFLKKIYFKK